MEKLKKIWLDGKLVDWEKAKIHVLTHGLHYGSAVFEGIRAYKTKKGSAVFRLDDHLERFFYSASQMRINIDFSQEEIKEAILKLIKVNKAEECYIRPIAFLGYGKMGLNPKGCPSQTAIINWPWRAYLGGGKPIETSISDYIRIHPQSTVIDAKISGCYFNSILSTLDAEDVDESILLDYEGYVAEGPGENIFIVKNGKLLTPSRGTILPGITRESVIEIASDLGIEVEEKKITVEELKEADEAFFVGTAAEICPIGKIDNQEIKTGEITKKIKKEFKKITRGEKYLKWLTFCE